MNIVRGLFRAWIVITAIWAILTYFVLAPQELPMPGYGYDPHGLCAYTIIKLRQTSTPQKQLSSQEEDCLEKSKARHRDDVSKTLAVAFWPPAVLVVLGFALLWIAYKMHQFWYELRAYLLMLALVLIGGLLVEVVLRSREVPMKPIYMWQKQEWPQIIWH